jgi:putative DNA primase/helicase
VDDRLEAIEAMEANAVADDSASSACSDSAVVLVRATDITPQSIAWLWNEWLAAGKFHVLAGQPGTGKTTIALAMAAAVSSGGEWPDKSRVPLGNVVMWSGEDDAADTLVPRLRAMGARADRVHLVRNVGREHRMRPFNPARDMPLLEIALQKMGGVRLLIVDPVVSAIEGDSHKNAEVRRGLQPLVDLAQRLNCAVLGITHLSKGTAGREPIERVTGSIAFGAVPRVVLFAAIGEDGNRLLVRAKSNIGPDAGGFEFRLESAQVPGYPDVHASTVVWGEEVSGSAHELLASVEPMPGAEHEGDAGSTTMTAEAMELLRQALSSGPLESKVVKELARDAGISPKPLRDAREALGVEHFREGYGKDTKTFWQLPASLMPSHANGDPSCERAEVEIYGTSGAAISATTANETPE